MFGTFPHLLLMFHVSVTLNIIVYFYRNSGWQIHSRSSSNCRKDWPARRSLHNWQWGSCWMEHIRSRGEGAQRRRWSQDRLPQRQSLCHCRTSERLSLCGSCQGYSWTLSWHWYWSQCDAAGGQGARHWSLYWQKSWHFTIWHRIWISVMVKKKGTCWPSHLQWNQSLRIFNGAAFISPMKHDSEHLTSDFVLM